MGRAYCIFFLFCLGFVLWPGINYMLFYCINKILILKLNLWTTNNSEIDLKWTWTQIVLTFLNMNCGWCLRTVSYLPQCPTVSFSKYINQHFEWRSIFDTDLATLHVQCALCNVHKGHILVEVSTETRPNNQILTSEIRFKKIV